MPDREKVIRGLECCAAVNCGADCPYSTVGGCRVKVLEDAISLLREQKEEQKCIVSWLGKFCAHADLQHEPLFTDEQNTEWFRQKMKQQFGWEVDE